MVAPGAQKPAQGKTGTVSLASSTRRSPADELNAEGSGTVMTSQTEANDEMANDESTPGGPAGADLPVGPGVGRVPEAAEGEGRKPAPLGLAPVWLRPLLVYQRGMDRVSDGVGALSKYLVMAVVAVGFLNAMLRYIGRFAQRQLASNTYLELQAYLYAAIFLLAFAYILKNGINVRVDFWFANRSDRTRAVIDFVGHLVGLLPFAVLALWVAYGPVMTSWASNEGSPDPGGLPRAPLKSLLLIGFGLLLLQGLAEMVKLIARLINRSDLVVMPDEAHGPPIRAE